MAVIYIDNEPYTTPAGKCLLDACLSLGFDIPYFCWHPALGSVGACRMCAVKRYKDEHDTAGRIVMSCMEPVEDGMRISINDPEARAFRARVIEWLMTNHPHDCPVCDEGGECHLQDMTLMSGHVYRTYRFKKRTHRNQDLGPFINHEMNRCIQCYRCVRYYRDYAGGRDLDVFGAHNHVYFGRHRDGLLENEFSGNLVEVCPTGVFTDKTLRRHFTRKWDLTNAPSVCVHCAAGCNILAGKRYGTLRRVLNRYNGEVNGYFLCDRGRFGYEFVNSEKRIRRTLHRNPNGPSVTIDKDTALRHGGDMLTHAKGLIGIGSPRASLESNFALRSLVGAENFYMGVSVKERALMLAAADMLLQIPARVPSLRDVEASDAVFILGGDVTAEAPRLALALRQASRNAPMKILQKTGIPRWNDAAVRTAIQDGKGPVFIASPMETRLDDIALQSLRMAPADIARLGLAAAREADENAPAVDGLDAPARETAAGIAHALLEADRPLVIACAGAGDVHILRAAANCAAALVKRGKNAGLYFTLQECNSLGLALMGGRNLDEAFSAVRDGRVDTAIILENDLYRRAETPVVDEFFSKCGNIIAMDYIENPTTLKSGLVFPAASFAESSGTLVGGEGRAQRFFSVFAPSGDIKESWRWIAELAAAGGKTSMDWTRLDEIIAAVAAAMPLFKDIGEAAPPASLRITGQKIARMTHRSSGRTAMNANVSVREPETPSDPDSALAFSMEGAPGIPPAPFVPFFWSPGWNSVQSVSRYQREVNGPLLGGDPGRRLIEPAGGGYEYSDDIPAPYKPEAGEFLVLPLYQVFGSEELSSNAPAIAERIPSPFIILNPEDAKNLDSAEGDMLRLRIGSVEFRLKLSLRPGIPSGCALISAGLPGMQYAAIPGRGVLERITS